MIQPAIPAAVFESDVLDKLSPPTKAITIIPPNDKSIATIFCLVSFSPKIGAENKTIIIGHR